ncbi:14199_t:CDS:2, partial [Funneliformis caledonium]
MSCNFIADFREFQENNEQISILSNNSKILNQSSPSNYSKEPVK